jgi:hypothetical protein
VPAEVSKRGVMIGIIEGALSSRRKRADIIIAESGRKSREKIAGEKKNAGCFF